MQDALAITAIVSNVLSILVSFWTLWKIRMYVKDQLKKAVKGVGDAVEKL